MNLVIIGSAPVTTVTESLLSGLRPTGIQVCRQAAGGPGQHGGVAGEAEALAKGAKRALGAGDEAVVADDNGLLVAGGENGAEQVALLQDADVLHARVVDAEAAAPRRENLCRVADEDDVAGASQKGHV